MLANISVIKYMYHILTSEKMEHRKDAFLQDCEETKFGMLWEILFETDIRDTVALRERIYQFGSVLKEQDYFGREVFLCLVAVLNLVIK